MPTLPVLAEAPHWLPVSLASISIGIAVLALTIAFYNFRLSRFPHVRASFKSFARETIDHPLDWFFEVEVESWGLPIWDMKVVLEADLRGLNLRLPFGTYKVEVPPAGSLPNPMNAGQVCLFRLNRTMARRHFKVGLSAVPAGKIKVCIYGSGQRLIKAYERKDFAEGFDEFDPRDDAPEAAKP